MNTVLQPGVRYSQGWSCQEARAAASRSDSSCGGAAVRRVEMSAVLNRDGTRIGAGSRCAAIHHSGTRRRVTAAATAIDWRGARAGGDLRRSSSWCSRTSKRRSLLLVRTRVAVRQAVSSRIRAGGSVASSSSGGRAAGGCCMVGTDQGVRHLRRRAHADRHGAGGVHGGGGISPYRPAPASASRYPPGSGHRRNAAAGFHDAHG